MGMPIPNLDDRRFQDLVDDGKRLVQQRCPEWTDHNVHDPGVTLIEAFAYMTDQLLYRLNRVPDRMLVTFLDLIGVSLLPPTAARAPVTFWLSAPRPEDLLVPIGTEVATERTETTDPVVFTTVEDLTVHTCELVMLATSAEGGPPALREEELISGRRVQAFSDQPAYDDALMFALSQAVPSNVLVVRMDCQVEGVGVDPRNPPLAWEAWTPAGWVACEVERDGTGGLNRAGDVLLHVPATHQATVIAKRRAGWVRARVIPPVEGQPFYAAPPTVGSVSAFTIGGTVEAINADPVRNETIGLSEGVPGQVFTLQRPPVVPGAHFIVEVAGGGHWDEWEVVDNFADSGPQDRHVALDPTSGQITFGPAVREPDGTLRNYGAVPPKAAPIRVPEYLTGGGRRGNVSRGALSVLPTPIPFVDRTENRTPAQGGVDGETVEAAKVRGPLALRTRNRAVTVEDYEALARHAAPGVARVRCIAAEGADSAAGVRLLVVPDASDESGRLRFEDLVPSERVLSMITSDLDSRRVVGTRLIVEPPFYQGITVVARIVARPRTDPVALREDALAALYRYFNPLRGGPDQVGWPFGRPVHSGEVFGVLQAIPGTELVEDVLLFAADPITGERGDPVSRIEVDANSLVFSFDHQVRVSAGG
jgi:predicted phage baseplate assembly protein